MLLSEWMKENRWNPTQMAKKTGLSRLTITNIMERKSEISLRTAFIIREFTKNSVTLEDLRMDVKSSEVTSENAV